MPIRVIQGDITSLGDTSLGDTSTGDTSLGSTAPVDAIVNAANSSLMGGGGVDGAIHRAGGPSILAECRVIVARQGGCPPGSAVITGAGDLPAKSVIHTVGPVWPAGTSSDEAAADQLDATLASCYTESLRLAVENGHRSVAFPNISTGVYGYPKDRAAIVAVNATQQFLTSQLLTTEPDLDVTFVCFDDENYQIYRRAIRPDLVTRPGRPSDAERIADYHHQCWKLNFAPLVDLKVMSTIKPRLERWNTWLADGSDFVTIVAVDESDEPIGHTTVQGNVLVHLFIDPAHHGRGLGRQLLAIGEQLIADGGHVQAELHTLVGNSRAIALYESCDWVVTDKTVDEVLENGASYPEHVLLKDLSVAARG